METAARAFAEHGVDGMPLNDLVVAGGMSNGANGGHDLLRADWQPPGWRVRFYGTQEQIGHLLHVGLPSIGP